ncbi:MAG: SBBP repeat-containing protein, partial [Candidatus Gracilibacteria bacterium]|nr:SBBP repeat-containing protein [Candidatus Gracilibacteria bacterium]
MNIQKILLKKYHPYGFTLVELLVVIAILTILGTVGLAQFGGFASPARDSARLSNLVNLKQVLDSFRIQSGNYPMPEDAVTLMASGIAIGYQGFAKDTVANIAKMSAGGTIDPSDPTMYMTYLTDIDRSQMQLMTFLEDRSSITSFTQSLQQQQEAFLPTLYANSTSDYLKRYPRTVGDRLGILLDNGTGSTKNQPIQERLSVSSIDITTIGSGYTAIFSDTSTDRVSGTGLALVQLVNTLVPNISFPFTKTLGGSGSSYPSGLFVDRFGYTYVMGRYSNTLANTYGTKDFAGNTLLGSPAALTDTNADIFVAKLNSLGQQMWIRIMGGSGNDVGRGIAIDTNGDVYVGGLYFNNSSNGNNVKDFIGNTLSGASVTASSDGFVAKLSGSDGSQQWIAKFGGTGAEKITTTTLDANGNLYVGGSYSTGAKNFMGNTVSNLGLTDGFVAKLSGTDGSQSWFKTFGGTGSDLLLGVTVDTNGNLYAGGYYPTIAKDFAGNTVSNLGSNDGFVAKLSGTDGSQSWFKTFGGTGDDGLYGRVAADANGNLYVGGYYST